MVSARATSHFDPVEDLTDHFYTVLAELHVQARAWEASAPQAEKMHPATMARLWMAGARRVHRPRRPCRRCDSVVRCGCRCCRPICSVADRSAGPSSWSGRGYRKTSRRWTLLVDKEKYDAMRPGLHALLALSSYMQGSMNRHRDGRRPDVSAARRRALKAQLWRTSSSGRTPRPSARTKPVQEIKTKALAEASINEPAAGAAAPTDHKELEQGGGGREAARRRRRPRARGSRRRTYFNR